MEGSKYIIYLAPNSQFRAFVLFKLCISTFLHNTTFMLWAGEITSSHFNEWEAKVDF